MKGTNREIGRALAEIARDQYGARPMRSPDTSLMRASRKYLQQHYPIFAERIPGAADAFGHEEGDDAAYMIGVPFLLPLPGCSAMYIPPKNSADGGARLSKNGSNLADFGEGLLCPLTAEKGLPRPEGGTPRCQWTKQ